METITLRIRISGDYTEQELKDFLIFELQGGSLENENPFILDENGAEITRVDID